MFSRIWQSMTARYGYAFWGYGLLGLMFLGLMFMFWPLPFFSPVFGGCAALSVRMGFAKRKMRTVRLRNEELARLQGLAERRRDGGPGE